MPSNAEARRSAAGIVTPNSAKDADWRREVGGIYAFGAGESGILTGEWDTFAAADGLDVFDETIGDGASDLVPYPLTFNTSLAERYRAPWFCVASEFSGTVSRTTAAYSACGATLLSPLHVLMAGHCSPTGLYFKDVNGTEHYRTIAASTTVASDVVLARLSSAITTISPVGVLANGSAVVGKYGGVLEAGRFITRVLFTEVEEFWSVTASVVETGDSGHPVFAINGTTPLFIGMVNGVGATDVGQSIHWIIDDINAVLAGYSESLTVYSLPASQSISPSFSPMRRTIKRTMLL